MKPLIPFVFMLPAACFAAHPLITDDTGTQGAGGFQFELNADRSRADDSGNIRRSLQANATLTYGWSDVVDLAVNVPYTQRRAGDLAREAGQSDASLALKWRIWEKDGFSLGLKPQVFLPTGDVARHLGNGKTGYGANLLASWEYQDLTLLVNAGGTRNRNANGDRIDLWNLSAAALLKIEANTRLLLDTGRYRDADASGRHNPGFVVAGMIYSPNDRMDIDFGVRKGFNRVAAERVAGAGLTLRW